MKDEILKIALKQLLKFGVREVSIQRLSELLGISTKTFYKHFENKEALLEEAAIQFYNEQFLQLRKLSEEKNVVQVFLDVWYSAIEREYKAKNLFFKELQSINPKLYEKIETTVGLHFNEHFIALINKGIREGYFIKNILPEVAMESIYLFYNGITRKGQYNKFPASPFDLLLNTIGVYIGGLCTEKGRSELDAYILTLKPFGKTQKKNKNLIKE